MIHAESPLLVISALILAWGAAAWDVKERRVPNALVFPAAVLGIFAQLLMSGFDGALQALSGLGLGLALMMPGYLIGTTGAGDVKLMAAVGTFLGPYSVLLAGLASFAVGGLIALGFMASAVFSANTQMPWHRYQLMLKTLLTTGRPIYLTPVEGEVMGRKFPFAVSIALGTTLFLMWQSPLIRLTT